MRLALWLYGASMGYEQSHRLPSGWRESEPERVLRLTMTVTERMYPPSLVSSHPSPTGRELEMQLHIALCVHVSTDFQAGPCWPSCPDDISYRNCKCFRREPRHNPGEQKHGGTTVFFPSHCNFLSQTRLQIKNHRSLCSIPLTYCDPMKQLPYLKWLFPLTRPILFRGEACVRCSFATLPLYTICGQFRKLRMIWVSGSQPS